MASAGHKSTTVRAASFSAEVLSSSQFESIPFKAFSELSQSEDVEIFFLERDCLQELCLLEQRCYPAPWSNELIHGEFDKTVSFRLGIRESGTLVAYSFNYLVTDELHILNVAVAPEHRGRGLGRGLFAAVLCTAHERGARYAALEVRESNLRAQKLYSAFGFRIVGRRRAYYRNNGEDALVMERDL